MRWMPLSRRSATAQSTRAELRAPTIFRRAHESAGHLDRGAGEQSQADAGLQRKGGDGSSTKFRGQRSQLKMRVTPLKVDRFLPAVLGEAVPSSFVHGPFNPLSLVGDWFCWDAPPLLMVFKHKHSEVLGSRLLIQVACLLYCVCTSILSAENESTNPEKPLIYVDQRVDPF